MSLNTSSPATRMPSRVSVWTKGPSLWLDVIGRRYWLVVDGWERDVPIQCLGSYLTTHCMGLILQDDIFCKVFNKKKTQLWLTSSLFHEFHNKNKISLCLFSCLQNIFICPLFREFLLSSPGSQ